MNKLLSATRNIVNGYYNRDFLSLKNVNREDLELLFKVSQQMDAAVQCGTPLNLMAGKVLGLAFYQSSTRTRISFESAIVRLGGAYVGFADPKATRAGDYYSESLEDVMRVMDHYADIIVIRHFENFAPERAAGVTDSLIINAGDGYNEHPTQAIIDLYTILQKKGRIDGLKIALVGDMNMRVIHSMAVGLAKYDAQLFFVSPEEKKLPELWKDQFRKIDLDYKELRNLDSIIGDVDVIYLMPTVTPSYGVVRSEQVEERPKTPEAYIVTPEKLSRAKKELILLHPFPRLDELPIEVDSLPQATYFAEAQNGVVVRMALLALMAGKI